MVFFLQFVYIISQFCPIDMGSEFQYTPAGSYPRSRPIFPDNLFRIIQMLRPDYN